MEGSPTSYMRGEKGSLGIRIFFKAVVCLLVFQMTFLGISPAMLYAAGISISSGGTVSVGAGPWTSPMT